MAKNLVFMAANFGPLMTSELHQLDFWRRTLWGPKRLALVDGGGFRDCEVPRLLSHPWLDEEAVNPAARRGFGTAWAGDSGISGAGRFEVRC